MFDKFGEFDSAEEINRAAAAQLKEGDLDAIKTIAEENGLDPEDAEDFCTGAIDSLTICAENTTKTDKEQHIIAERPENCYAGSSRGSTKKPTQGKNSEH